MTKSTLEALRESKLAAELDAAQSEVLAGILTMSDVVRAQARAALDAGEIERTVTPEFATGRD